MSSFHDRVRKPKNDPNANPAWFDKVYARFPEIANVLAGNPGNPPDVPAVPPMSIIISDRKGTLQFCISAQGGSDMWFGIIDAPDTLLEAIDQVIAFGELTYQEKRSKGYRP